MGSGSVCYEGGKLGRPAATTWRRLGRHGRDGALVPRLDVEARRLGVIRHGLAYAAQREGKNLGHGCL